MVKALVQYGADIWKVDNIDMTALDVATQGSVLYFDMECSHINKDICQFLMNRMKKVTSIYDHQQGLQSERNGKILKFWKPCVTYLSNVLYAVQSGHFTENLLHPNRLQCLGRNTTESRYAIQAKYVLTNQQRKYITNDSKMFLELRNERLEFVQSLMSTPGIGPLRVTPKVRRVMQVVDILMKRLACMVGELDPLFECEAVLTGSVSEGTKVGLPDEFDYNFIMKKLDMSTVPLWSEKDGSPSSYHRERKQQIYKINFATKERHSQLQLRKICHSSHHMHHYLTILILRVMSAESLWHRLPLVHILPKEEHRATYQVYTLHLMWCGPELPGMVISVDIMAMFNLQVWPDDCLTQSCVLIPQREKEKLGAVVLKKTNYMLSAGKLERHAIQRMPVIPKMAYILCKIVMEILRQCGERTPSSYDLKNGLLHICDKNPDWFSKQNDNLKREDDNHYILDCICLSDLRQVIRLAVQIIETAHEKTCTPIHAIANIADTKYNVQRYMFQFNQECSDKVPGFNLMHEILCEN